MIEKTDCQFADLSGHVWTAAVGKKTIKKLRQRGIDFQGRLTDYIGAGEHLISDQLEIIFAFICDELSAAGIGKEAFIDRMNAQTAFFGVAACAFATLDRSFVNPAHSETIGGLLTDHVDAARRVAQRAEALEGA